MLELRGVTKEYYDDNVILEDISPKINKGETVSILGPSGCGKTALLHTILGLMDVNECRLVYNGEDITRVPMKKRGSNIVFEFLIFEHHMIDVDDTTYKNNDQAFIKKILFMYHYAGYIFR